MSPITWNAFLASVVVCAMLADRFASHLVYYRTIPPRDGPEGQAARRAWRDRWAMLRGRRQGTLSWYPAIVLLVLSLPVLIPWWRWYARPQEVLCLMGLWPLALVPASIGLTTLAGLWIRGGMTPGASLRGFGRALVSWCGYNQLAVKAPGVWISPVGCHSRRMGLTIAAFYAVTTSSSGVAHWLCSPIDGRARFASWYMGEPSAILIVFLILFPLAFMYSAVFAISAPALVVVSRVRAQGTLAEAMMRRLRASADPLARESFYAGRLAYDGSPVLPPLMALAHSFWLGPTRLGKTTMGLGPAVESLIEAGYSVIVIDLKGDDFFLWQCCRVAVERRRIRTGMPVPLYFFTNQVGLASHVFNMLDQPWFRNLTTFQTVDVFASVFSLSYGTGYGKSYFGSANAELLYFVLSKYRNQARSFRELYRLVIRALKHAKKDELNPELRRAGSHVLAVLRRLGDLEALNATKESHYEAAANGIELTRFFEDQCIGFFRLPVALSPGVSPEIARQVAFGLLTAAEVMRPRQKRVFLVIDEFPTMVTKQLSYLLAAAHGMDVGVLISVQSMRDLRTDEADLRASIFNNTKYKVIYGVNDPETVRDLEYLSGLTMETLQSTTCGPQGTSVTTQEVMIPRLTANEIARAMDDPSRCLVQFKPGSGFAPFDGELFEMEVDYHISEQEYLRRLNAPWPSASRETVVQTAEGSGDKPAHDEDDDDGLFLGGASGGPPKAPPGGGGKGGTAKKPPSEPSLESLWEEQQKPGGARRQKGKKG